MAILLQQALIDVLAWMYLPAPPHEAGSNYFPDDYDGMPEVA